MAAKRREAKGVPLQVRHASEQDDGHFTILRDISKSIQVPLDLGTGGIIGGGKEQVGIVDQDQTDGRVLME